MARPTLLTSLNRLLSTRSWGEIAAGTFATTVLLGMLDLWVGRALSLGALYIVPVGIAAWYAGRDVGFAVALCASVFALLGFEAVTGELRILARSSNWIMLAMLFLLVAELVNRVHTRLELEQQLARIDTLTGSLNKRAFEEELEYHLALATRERLPLTLAYIDVDNFKDINDRYGHAGGDRVLQSIAVALKAFTRRTDRVTRLGGDEFAVLLPDTSSDGAERIIRVARKAFADAFSPGHPIVTCSIGVVTFTGQLPAAADAIAHADALMYEVKRAGKGEIRFRTVAAELTRPLVSQ